MYLNNWPLVSSSRDGQKDQEYLINLFRRYKQQKLPLVLWLFAEGTRLTPKKLAASQKYAAETGKPHLRHVMMPRYKAFVASALGLRGVVDYVYDATLAYDGWGTDR